MSPQVIAAIIAAGVGLLAVGRAGGVSGLPRNQLGHSEGRSKRQGKHLDRTLAEAAHPGGGS